MPRVLFVQILFNLGSYFLNSCLFFFFFVMFVCFICLYSLPSPSPTAAGLCHGIRTLGVWVSSVEIHLVTAFSTCIVSVDRLLVKKKIYMLLLKMAVVKQLSRCLQFSSTKPPS